MSRSIAPLLAALLLGGCASLGQAFDTPTVLVQSVQPQPGAGLLPDLELTLGIQNPNAIPLALAGLAVNVSINGREVMSGVANDLPAIPAYGEEQLTIRASANLFGSAALLRDLLSDGADAVDYELRAKLDLGGLRPAIRVTHRGTLALGPRY